MQYQYAIRSGTAPSGGTTAHISICVQLCTSVYSCVLSCNVALGVTVCFVGREAVPMGE